MSTSTDKPSADASAAPPSSTPQSSGAAPAPAATATSGDAKTASAPSAPSATEEAKPQTAPAAGEAKPAAGAGVAKPATEGKAVSPTKRSAPLASTRLRSAFARLALGLSGAGLLAGFFMPWVTKVTTMPVSGFDLMVSQGEVIELLSGPYRMLLLAVPVSGALLMLGAITGHRASLWVALLAGLLVLGYGTVTLILLFLETTGLGLWVVVGAAFLSFGLALLTLGRRLRQ